MHQKNNKTPPKSKETKVLPSKCNSPIMIDSSMSIDESESDGLVLPDIPLVPSVDIVQSIRAGDSLNELLVDSLNGSPKKLKLPPPISRSPTKKLSLFPPPKEKKGDSPTAC